MESKKGESYKALLVISKNCHETKHCCNRDNISHLVSGIHSAWLA